MGYKILEYIEKNFYYIFAIIACLLCIFTTMPFEYVDGYVIFFFLIKMDDDIKDIKNHLNTF